MTLLFFFVLWLAGFLMMVSVTGDKDFHEFTKNETIITVILGIISAIFFGFSLFMATKIGQKMRIIRKLEYRIGNIIMKKNPLPSGNVVSIYEDQICSTRVVVYELPNDGGFYYLIEELKDNYEFEVTYTSEIFDDEEAMDMDFDDYIEVTDIYWGKKNR